METPGKKNAACIGSDTISLELGSAIKVLCAHNSMLVAT